MQLRLERILTKLAERENPRILIEWQTTSDQDHISRLQWLARRLASQGFVLLIGQLEATQAGRLPANTDLHIRDWLTGYADLHGLLARQLFPANAQINATYADNGQNPWVVLTETRVAALSEVFAGYIAPYLAYRQQNPPATELELRGLMDIVLYDKLVADNLSVRDYHLLMEQGVEQLQRMLNTHMQHISVTGFERPLITSLEPQRPSTLPEQDEMLSPRETFKRNLDRIESDDSDLTATNQMFLNPALPRKRDDKGDTGPLRPRRDNGRKPR